MDFIPALPTYGADFSARNVWGWFEQALQQYDGIAYYKHPIVGSVLAQPEMENGRSSLV